MWFVVDMSAAPTPMPAGDFALPDLSKPPPGFPPAAPGLPPPLGGPPMLPTDMDLTPSVPYYDLPAGLMAPLVKVRCCVVPVLFSVFLKKMSA